MLKLPAYIISDSVPRPNVHNIILAIAGRYSVTNILLFYTT